MTNIRRLAPQARARAHLDSQRCVVLDTETTGLGPDAEIVEIAIIDLDGQVILDTLVRPTIPIPSRATAVHGITDADVVNSPTFADIWPRLQALLDGKRMWSYNVAFDMRLIRQSAEAHGLFAPIVWADCIMVMASNYLLSRRWLKLADAARLLDVPPQDPAHRALGDARTALAIYKAIYP